MLSHLGVLAAALLIDRTIGEPAWLWRRIPHPVVGIGWCISKLDAALNDPGLPFGPRRRRGVGALFLLVLGGVVGAKLISAAAAALPYGSVLEALGVAVLLAHKSLVDHVREVQTQIRSAGLEGGRRAVSMIVGRDASVLDQAAVARAAIESAAENFADGVVAPAFWYAVLGLPGLLVYKIANTADSMIGHRSERYLAFGWAAARLDDLLNLVPARLTALLIAGAAVVARVRAGHAVRAAFRDARLHRSPNAGWPEAAAAGALGLALGGPRRYGELLVDGAWLNPGGRRDATAEDIAEAIRLIDVAWALLVVAAGLSALSIAL